MINKFNIFILSCLILIGFGTYQVIENKKEKDKKLQIEKAIQQKIEVKIKEVITKNNADMSWYNELKEIESKNLNLLSIQIENVIKKNPPIVFYGNLVDLETKSDGSYHLVFEKSLYSNFLITDISLSMNCSNEKVRNIQSLIEGKSKANYFDKAVTAIINPKNVSSVFDKKENYSKIEHVINGECIDLIEGVIEDN
jgi:hypothetical protein